MRNRSRQNRFEGDAWDAAARVKTPRVGYTPAAARALPAQTHSDIDGSHFAFTPTIRAVRPTLAHRARRPSLPSTLWLPCRPRRSGTCSAGCPSTSCRTCSFPAKLRYFSATTWSGSESSGKFSSNLSRNLPWLADAIGADSQHLGPEFLELRLLVAKRAGLAGAARRVVAGIEIDHHRPTLQVRQSEPSSRRRPSG